MRRGWIIAAGVLLLARAAGAQTISPGPLARVHERLEGITSCTACHELGKGVTNARCLDCHTELAARINAKKGWHAGPSVASVGKCATCHRDHVGRDFQIIDWPGGDRARFPHAETGFALEGAHARLECAKCHDAAKPTFLGREAACISCHEDVHRGTLGKDCASCHDAAAWKTVTRFDHAKTAFPLAGAHATTACAKCHGPAPADPAARVFKGVKHDACTACHEDRHQGRMGADCRSCHDESRWKPAAYAPARHEKLPLTGAHGRAECASCHGPRLERSVAGAACATCHEDKVHKGSLGARCDACHGVEAFQSSTFALAKHAPARFPLAGVHATTACEKCHIDAEPLAAPATATVASHPATACAACHKDTHAGRLGQDCARCHTAAAWGPVAATAFDAPAHRLTRFPLTGAHTTVACARCHLDRPDGSGRLAKIAPIAHEKCRDCHEDAHKGELARRPDGGACESCHDTPAWRPARYDRREHDATRFPLTGAHAAVACAACHGGSAAGGRPAGGVAARPLKLKPAAASCGGCHEDPHRGQYGSLPGQGKCDSCHSVERWKPGVPFDHSKTAFSLNGAHAAVACTTCHAPPPAAGGRARPAEKACAACHEDPHLGQFARRGDPEPLGCQDCHGTRAFRPADKFDHARDTRFPLDGKHAALACATCHRAVELAPGLATALYRPLPFTCAGCHVDQHAGQAWKEKAEMKAAARRIALLSVVLAAALAARAPTARAQTPPHFPGDDCARCHSTGGWERLKPVVKDFAHATTGFPLRGAHATIACDRCHDGRGTARAGEGCAGCHKDPHRGEQGTECERCHDERSFRMTDALVKHRATRFPLEGSHALIECGACHLDRAAGRFTGVPTECVACHQRDYAATKAPNHATNGFSTECQDCHRPTSWTGAKIFHDRFFALRGAHAALACASCHPNGRFAGTPRDCMGCHATQFNSTTNPNHPAAGFSTNCQDCHGFASWTPAKINHDRFFPLTGAHASASCTACHPGGRFSGTPRDCYGCHAADYNATTNPSHASSGFGTSCQDCHHSTTTWSGATFNHDGFFPISSGAHSRFRNDCNACHPQPANKAVFTCVACHGRSETDGHHRSVSGYSYTDAACYRCHPRGRGDD